MTDIRLLLNDKAIARLPNPASGWYLARDTELKGFFVVVGKRKKTFTVHGDLRRAGKRASTVRVSIGDVYEVRRAPLVRLRAIIFSRLAAASTQILRSAPETLQTSREPQPRSQVA